MSVGVYIKGMEMPTDCALLLKIFPDGRVGVPVHLTWMGTLVVNDAEAIPVPPHGRLIDADALIKSDRMVGKLMMYGGEYVYTQAEIDRAPTIIPAEEGER